MTTVTRRTTDRRVRRDQENVGPSRQERLLEDLKSDMHSPEKYVPNEMESDIQLILHRIDGGR